MVSMFVVILSAARCRRRCRCRKSPVADLSRTLRVKWLHLEALAWLSKGEAKNEECSIVREMALASKGQSFDEAAIGRNIE